MLSLKHRFIYIHIPKTGGNSIQTTLAPFSEDRVVFRRSIGKLIDNDATQGLDVLNPALGFDHPAHKHATLEDYARTGKLDLKAFRIFASVRNPYDRVVSNTIFMTGPMDRKLRGDEIVWPTPQVRYLALGGRLTFSDVIRFEFLEDSFALVCKRLGLPPLELPHKNASQRSREFDFYLDEQAKSQIRNVYRDDFEAFGYEQ